ncbi:MAG: hypothetical protein CM15mV51_1220 [uncultured marine virus]|nr:MAG: hypothetical protein CM15mV51_1220 [uncultured marine virus]
MIVKDGMMYKTGSLMQAISPFAISSYLNQTSNVAKSLESNEEEDIQYVW